MTEFRPLRDIDWDIVAKEVYEKSEDLIMIFRDIEEYEKLNFIQKIVVIGIVKDCFREIQKYMKDIKD